MTKQKTIPKFENIKDEAQFWDTHDITDYLHEMRPVKVKFAKPLKHIFTVRFDGRTLTEIQTEAGKKGLSAGTLIRMWVKEKLQDIGYQTVSK